MRLNRMVGADVRQAECQRTPIIGHGCETYCVLAGAGLVQLEPGVLYSSVCALKDFGARCPRYAHTRRSTPDRAFVRDAQTWSLDGPCTSEPEA